MTKAITAQQFRRMESFIKSLLNPEELGLAVPAHVRDSAREALGRERVEEPRHDRLTRPVRTRTYIITPANVREREGQDNVD